MSKTQLIQAGPTPQVDVRKVAGSLHLTGWDRPELQLRGRHAEAFSVEEGDGCYTITCDSDLVLQVPLQTMLKIGHVAGDGNVSMVLHSITLDVVAGDLNLSSVNAATIKQVSGDLAISLIAGDLAVERVGGDARAARIAGDVRFECVGGDLALSGIVGSVHGVAGGDIKADVILAGDQRCMLKASGDIACAIPSDASARVKLTAGGDIRVKNLGEKRKGTAETLQFELGTGAATVELEAGGDVMLRGMEPGAREGGIEITIDLEEEMARRAVEMTQQITAQIEAQVSALSRQLDAKLSELGANDELAASIQERVQGAMRKAEEKLADTMRKLEQRLQENERRASDAASRRRKSYSWQAPPPRPAAPKRPKATDEERMMILRMVEQGKISVEQAEKLLAALSGETEGR